MNVIDSLIAISNPSGFRLPDEQTALLTCMLVCRAWKSYAQRFLHHHVYIKVSYDCNNLPGWRDFLKYNPSKAKSIESIQVDCYEVPLSYSAMFLTQKLPSLVSLHISGWDLDKESTWIYRAVKCMTSVKDLHLYNLLECTAAQLIKLVNSFHSLSKLQVVFDPTNEVLLLKNQPLSKPCKLTTFSLTSLEIDLIPGIANFLGWLVKANYFVTNLKKLNLVLQNGDEIQSRCEGVTGLLSHCGSSLEELTLEIYPRPTADVINLSKSTREGVIV